MMNGELNLSSRFNEKLGESQKWLVNVKQVFANVKDYYYISPRFFPEYTHHGIFHIRITLELCDKLIPDKTLSIMTARELGILVIAVMLHDIGMFVDKDGMRKILYGGLSQKKTPLLDHYTWEEEWQRYIYEISRYSDKKWRRIFGENDYREDFQEENITDMDKNVLIYGDFLRRNHGRLAYDIIKCGFPGKEDLDVLRNTDIDGEIRDIIALIARSHTMELRETLDYLEEWYMPPTEPKNIKIFYLMAVLRIADYLDAGYERASHVIESLRTTRSSVSKEEYSWNQVIDYDDYDWKKKLEMLVIHANPTCSTQFLKVESWLQSLQKQLDLCWAVLGEVYTSKSLYNLTIRRINSNILVEKTRKNFEKRFVTRRAVLDTNPDILKLLIYPLYNEESKYGVRELLQNAIDACNERQEIERQEGKESYQSKVRVEIDREKNQFRIEDNGIGMTEDVIINYFLISGASFRNSETWEGKFVKDGESVIARTGKFGIGVLSAFLLGNYVEVTTRSINEDLGYSFGIEIGRENINIERIEAPIGTKLVISSNTKILDEVVSGMEYPKWNDWYCFQKPAVEYVLDGQEIYHQEEYVPSAEEDFAGWYRLEGTEFASYKWSYEAEQLAGINVFCNGIPVTNGTVLNAEEYGFPLSTPTISIVDYNNKVHINLSRDRLTEFPAEKVFVKEGYKFVIMRLLETKEISGFHSCYQALHQGFPYSKKFKVSGKSSANPSHFIFSQEGFTLMSPMFLKHANAKEIVMVCIKANMNDEPELQVSDIPLWLCEVGAFRRRSFFLRLFTSIFDQKEIKEEAIQFAVESKFYNTELKDYFIEQGLSERIDLYEEKDGFYDFIVDEKIKGENEHIDFKLASMEEKGVLMLIRFRLDFQEGTNLMEELLKENLGTVGWIPYEYEERVRACSNAYEKLSIYADQK